MSTKTIHIHKGYTHEHKCKHTFIHTFGHTSMNIHLQKTSITQELVEGSIKTHTTHIYTYIYIYVYAHKTSNTF